MPIDNRAKWLARQIVITYETPNETHIAVELQTANLVGAVIWEGGIPVVTGISAFSQDLLRALLEELNVRVSDRNTKGTSPEGSK